jgi:hypothetical protein
VNVGGVETETRTVDRSSWMRGVGEIAESAGAWVQSNTEMAVLAVAAVLVAMIVLRLLIRGGFRRSTRF